MRKCPKCGFQLDKELTAEDFERHRKEVTSSREKAVESLCKAGIVDKHGKLKKEYGGKA